MNVFRNLEAKNIVDLAVVMFGVAVAFLAFALIARIFQNTVAVAALILFGLLGPVVIGALFHESLFMNVATVTFWLVFIPIRWSLSHINEITLTGVIAFVVGVLLYLLYVKLRVLAWKRHQLSNSMGDR